MLQSPVQSRLSVLILLAAGCIGLPAPFAAAAAASGVGPGDLRTGMAITAIPPSYGKITFPVHCLNFTVFAGNGSVSGGFDSVEVEEMPAEEAISHASRISHLGALLFIPECTTYSVNGSKPAPFSPCDARQVAAKNPEVRARVTEFLEAKSFQETVKAPDWTINRTVKVPVGSRSHDANLKFVGGKLTEITVELGPFQQAAWNEIASAVAQKYRITLPSAVELRDFNLGRRSCVGGGNAEGTVAVYTRAFRMFGTGREIMGMAVAYRMTPDPALADCIGRAAQSRVSPGQL